MRVLAFDIETAAAEDMHRYGPGFVRLCGWSDATDPAAPVETSIDPADLVRELLAADATTAHNGVKFDLMALAREGFITFDQYETLAARMFDTMLVEQHLNPIAARGVQPKGYYSLGTTAARYGLDGKDTVDFEGKTAIVRRIKGDRTADQAVKARAVRIRKAEEKAALSGLRPGAVTALIHEETFSVLKVLADLYDGFDKIPQDDPDYVRYLHRDVQAQGALFRKLQSIVNVESERSRAYIRREHYTTLAMGRTTLEGLRTDTDLTMKRWAEGQARLDAGKQLLHRRFGMPLEGKKPHVTNAGKAAFRNALIATGISPAALERNWPRGKDGFLLTGKDVLNEMIPLFERVNPAAADLCKTILAMNGERSIYGTMLDHTVNGRVHPYIGADQASGRWSMRDPGITVFGKRGGKARERAVILADNDDEVLAAIDADQVDARVIAAECQDPAYMRLFRPGMDLHSEVAWLVFADPDCRAEMDRNNGRCDCEHRQNAKIISHGFSYGLGANGIVRQNGVSLEVAERFIRGFTQAFPRLAEWKDEMRARAGAVGFDEEVPENDSYRILHTWKGRPVRVDRKRAYTQATAMIGQGGTRDVMAEAILKLPRETRRRVRAVIHDEIILSLPKNGAQEAAQGIADSMAFNLRGVDITFGVSRVSRSWAGCYGEQYEEAA